MILLIPAAGAGSRVQEGNFIPKPAKKISGKSFLYWSIRSFQSLINQGDLLYSDIFVILNSDHENQFNLISSFKEEISKDLNFIVLDHLTSGPAQTVSEGLNRIAEIRNLSSQTMMVADCDSHTHSDGLFRYFKSFRHEHDQVICAFTKKEPTEINWAEPALDGEGHLIQIVEKRLDSTWDDLIDPRLGLTGTIIFHNALFVANSLEVFLSSAKTQSEIFLSHFVNYLISLSVEVRFFVESYFVPFGTHVQIEKAQIDFPKLLSNREPPSFFIDLDGTLFVHERAQNGFYSYPPTLLNDSFPKFIRELFNGGSRIILTTARSEKNRHDLETYLAGFDIPFDELITGLGGGKRILVNDLKPDLFPIPTALSVNLVRNSGTFVNYAESLVKNQITIIEKLKGGSTGETYLMQEGENRFVRKILPKNGPVSSSLLNYQASWFNLVRQHFPPFSPQVIRYDENFEYEILDTKYIPEVISIGHALDQHESVERLEVFSNFLDSLKKLYSINPSDNRPFTELRNAFINKAYPSIDYAEKQLNLFANSRKIVKMHLNGEPIFNSIPLSQINDRIKRLLGHYAEVILQTELFVSLIHGDLTLENVGYSDRPIFFDPIGPFAQGNFGFEDGLVGSSLQILDASRIWLSLKMNYHNLDSSKASSLSGIWEVNFPEMDGPLSGDSYYGELKRAFSIDNFHRSLVFDLVNLLTMARILKYKVDRDPHHALIMFSVIEKLILELEEK